MAQRQKAPPSAAASKNGPKRVMAPASFSRASRAISSSASMPSPAATAAKGSGTSGKPSCSAFRMRRSSASSSGGARSHAAAPFGSTRAPRCLKQRTLKSTALGRPARPDAASARARTASASGRVRAWIMQ